MAIGFQTVLQMLPRRSAHTFMPHSRQDIPLPKANLPLMLWYLPDRYPVFWEQVRRRVLGRHVRRAVHTGVVLAVIGVAIGLWPLITDDAGSYGRDYWLGVMAVQAFFAMLFAPGLAVGSFTAERERGSLDFLFLTPLSTRALALQRYAGCNILLVALMLCFLPLSLFSALVGHVSLHDVAVEYLFQLVQGMSFVAAALLASYLARNTRVAIIITYGWIFLLEYVGHRLLAEQLFNYYAASHPTPLAMLLTGRWQPLFALMPYLLITTLAVWICILVLERQRRPVVSGDDPQRRRTHTVAAHPALRWYLPEKHPILWDDLRRRLRGGRTYTVLLGFALAMCGMLVVITLLTSIGNGPLAWPKFGHELFTYVIGGQLVLMCIISPGLTATIFSSEREARRIDLLLLSRLTSRELVYEKFAGALVLLLLTLLCGLPVVAIIVATFGGVSPWELGLGYLLILLCGLFCASTALLYSCKAKNSSAALFEGYLISVLATIGLAVLTGCFIGPVLAIIEIFRNLNHAANRLDDWRRHQELEDPYAIPMMQGVEDHA